MTSLSGESCCIRIFGEGVLIELEHLVRGRVRVRCRVRGRVRGRVRVRVGVTVSVRGRVRVLIELQLTLVAWSPLDSM